jgi:hypothetical protein
MKRRSHLRTVSIAWALLGALLALPAAAEPSSESAERSFKQFAASWMKQIGRDGERPRDAASGLVRTIVRRVSSDFTTQLRATGKTAAPYVGILSYTEHVYSCSGPAEADCEILESSPVTELFPLQGGEWKY